MDQHRIIEATLRAGMLDKSATLLADQGQEIREAVDILKLVKDHAPLNLLEVINAFVLRNGG